MIVRWKTRGSLVECGEAYSRRAGEEDEMPEAEARTLVTAGMVEMVKSPVPTVAEVNVEEDER